MSRHWRLLQKPDSTTLLITTPYWQNVCYGQARYTTNKPTRVRNAYNVVINGEQRINHNVEHWHNYDCAHPSLWQFTHMLKIDVTKMNTTSTYIQMSTNTINEIKSILWMLLRHQVYILNCTASYFQGAAYRLTTNPKIGNKNYD